MLFNSHGCTCSFDELKELEVDERENYTKAEFNRWKKKYRIKDDDEFIWVTADKKRAVTYGVSVTHYDAILKMNDKQLDAFISKNHVRLTEFKDDAGVIITESDDGDDGFLLILSKQH